MGPGTHVLNRLAKKVKPNTMYGAADVASMYHDVLYYNPDMTEQEADAEALRIVSKFNPLHWIMKTGFTVKDVFGGMKPEKDRHKYEHAKYLFQKNFPDLIEKYDLIYMK